jgi:hypothetical protein
MKNLFLERKALPKELGFLRSFFKGLMVCSTLLWDIAAAAI